MFSSFLKVICVIYEAQVLEVTVLELFLNRTQRNVALLPRIQ
jgi:hypothetical protein